MACDVRRPALTNFYAIAGRCVCVEALEPASATLCANFLEDFHLIPLEAVPNVTPSYTIRITSQGARPEIPKGLERFEVAFGRCHVNRSLYYLEVEDSLVLVSKTDAVTKVWVGSTRHARRPLSLANLMAYVLEGSLRNCGLYQLHGSGVVRPAGNRGLLIIGGSGSGKSTLATLLASRGWSYLTDDALLLTDEDGVVMARGMRKFFAASEKTVRACRSTQLERALGAPIASDPSKRRFDPGVAFPGRAREFCVPGALVFASISDDSNSRLSSLSTPEAMARLIKLNPWASYDKATARLHLRLLRDLVNQSQSFCLSAGSDMLADPAFANDLLAPLMDH